MASGRGLTAEQRAAVDQARHQTVEQLHDQLASHIGSLDNRDAWQAYLGFAAGFHQYSFSNSLLIMVQRPNATAVAGYRAWQAKGYQVRRAEKAIKVLGPITRTVALLDSQGHPVFDESGRARERRQLVGVRPVSVFDISQTDGPPAPKPPAPQLLTGQAPEGLWQGLADIISDHGFRLERGECGTANGYTNFAEKVVRVREDVDDAQAVRTLAHELGHVLLSEPGERALECRGLLEVEAESVAYMVTQAHGLDAGQYTFNYVTGWATQAGQGQTPEEVVRATGQRVISAVNTILGHTQRPVQDTPADALEADVDLNITIRQGYVEPPASTRERTAMELERDRHTFANTNHRVGVHR